VCHHFVYLSVDAAVCYGSQLISMAQKYGLEAAEIQSLEPSQEEDASFTICTGFDSGPKSQHLPGLELSSREHV
jgi:hypothetical protein